MRRVDEGKNENKKYRDGPTFADEVRSCCVLSNHR
jgi:hypothetical protein